jgi:YD repeat-containing protein
VPAILGGWWLRSRGRGSTLTYTGARDLPSAVYTNPVTGTGNLLTSYAYSYDTTGKFSTIRTDPIGAGTDTENTSSISDWLGRTVSSSSRDAGTTTSMYDPAGNLSTVAGPTGTVAYSYDVLERPTQLDETALGGGAAGAWAGAAAGG